MLRRPSLRLLALACLLFALTTQPFVGPLTPAQAPVPQASGTIPWHPHYAVTLASGVAGSVDLADAHVDLGLAGLQLPGAACRSPSRPPGTASWPWPARRASRARVCSRRSVRR